MKISAVIPVYNGEKFIAECIESLLNQTRKFDEILIIDDGSTDRTSEIVKKYPVTLISLKHGERSRTRNIGWKKAKHEIVAFIESDSVYSANWVAAVLEGFEKGYDAVIDRRAVYKPQTFIAKMNDNVFDVRYADYTPFSAWIFKKSILEKLNGFDKNLTHGEDVDLGQRLLKAGFKIYCAKDAFQYHMGEPSTLSHAIKRSYSFGKNMHKFFRKNPAKFNRKKIIAFTLLFFTFFMPPLFVILFSLLYFYVFFKFLNKLKTEFLLAYPLYVIITEFVFTCGYYAGFFSEEK